MDECTHTYVYTPHTSPYTHICVNTTHITAHTHKVKTRKKKHKSSCRCPCEPFRPRQEVWHGGGGWHGCEANPCWHFFTFEIITVTVSSLEDAAHYWGSTREINRERERHTHSGASKRSDILFGYQHEAKQLQRWSCPSKGLIAGMQFIYRLVCFPLGRSEQSVFAVHPTKMHGSWLVRLLIDSFCPTECRRTYWKPCGTRGPLIITFLQVSLFLPGCPKSGLCVLTSDRWNSHPAVCQS